MPNRNAKRRGRAESPVADFAKRVAMALAALAFSAGLHVQLGLNLVSALTGGLSLFFMVALSHAAFQRSRRNAQAIDELMGASASLARLDDMTLNMDQVGDVALRLEELSQRVDELDGRLTLAAVDGRPALSPAQAPALAAEIARKAAHVDRLTADVDRMNVKLESLRTQLAIEGRERHERVTAELQMLETLIKQMAEQIAVGPTKSAAAPARPAAPPRKAIATEDDPEDDDDNIVARAASETAAPESAPRAPAMQHGHELADEPPRFAAAVTGFDADQLDAAILEAVRRSVEANKVDLYLQPIVMLPQRRVRYYEALTRLRDGSGAILMPKDYLSVAEAAGMMPLIDNVMLYRSVQVLRRLSDRSSAKGVFCNISLHSLLDPEFFPEFVAFMEQNQGLADSLVFEFNQAMIKNCGPIEQESLGALASLGFRFALDQVRDLGVDFQALHAKGFRYVKVEADMLLHRAAQAGARIHAADMRAYLDRQGLELIVEKVEDERSLADLLDFDVKLGQGYLFSEPRPVRPEVFGPADTAAAA